MVRRSTLTGLLVMAVFVAIAAGGMTQQDAGATGPAGKPDAQTIADLTRAIELNPKDAVAYRSRADAFGRQGKLDEAMADCMRAIELDPSDALAYAFRGHVRLARNRPDEAIADYTRAIELDPNLAVAYYNRGCALSRQGKLDEAITDYTRAIELDPKYVAAYNNRGTALHALKRFDEAIADYTRILELNPEDVFAYCNRGLALEAQNRLPEAIADFTKAIEIDPKCVLACRNRGFCFGLQGRLDEAIADFTKAIESDREDAVACRFRGDALRAQGKLEDAIADYTRAIELDPTAASAYQNRGNALYDLKRLDEAIADYTRLIELNPRDPLPYKLRGDAFQGRAASAKAIDDYTKLIELLPPGSPVTPVAYNNRGEALEAQNKLPEAIADFTRAIGLSPKTGFLYRNRGDAFHLHERLDEAVADFTRAIELDPKDAVAYNNRGNAFQAKGKLGEAVADYTRAIELDPQQAISYGLRGLVLQSQGRLEEAIADFAKANELEPGNALAWRSKGFACRDANRTPEAIEAFQRFVQLAPAAGLGNEIPLAEQEILRLQAGGAAPAPQGDPDGGAVTVAPAAGSEGELVDGWIAAAVDDPNGTNPNSPGQIIRIDPDGSWEVVQTVPGLRDFLVIPGTGEVFVGCQDGFYLYRGGEWVGLCRSGATNGLIGGRRWGLGHVEVGCSLHYRTITVPGAGSPSASQVFQLQPEVQQLGSYPQSVVGMWRMWSGEWNPSPHFPMDLLSYSPTSGRGELIWVPASPATSVMGGGQMSGERPAGQAPTQSVTLGPDQPKGTVWMVYDGQRLPVYFFASDDTQDILYGTCQVGGNRYILRLDVKARMDSATTVPGEQSWELSIPFSQDVVLTDMGPADGRAGQPLAVNCPEGYLVFLWQGVLACIDLADGRATTLRTTFPALVPRQQGGMIADKAALGFVAGPDVYDKAVLDGTTPRYPMPPTFLSWQLDGVQGGLLSVLPSRVFDPKALDTSVGCVIDGKDRVTPVTPPVAGLVGFGRFKWPKRADTATPAALATEAEAGERLRRMPMEASGQEPPVAVLFIDPNAALRDPMSQGPKPPPPQTFVAHSDGSLEAHRGLFNASQQYQLSSGGGAFMVSQPSGLQRMQAQLPQMAQAETDEVYGALWDVARAATQQDADSRFQALLRLPLAVEMQMSATRDQGACYVFTKDACLVAPYARQVHRGALFPFHGRLSCDGKRLWIPQAEPAPLSSYDTATGDLVLRTSLQRCGLRWLGGGRPAAPEFAASGSATCVADEKGQQWVSVLPGQNDVIVCNTPLGGRIVSADGGIWIVGPDRARLWTEGAQRPVGREIAVGKAMPPVDPAVDRGVQLVGSLPENKQLLKDMTGQAPLPLAGLGLAEPTPAYESSCAQPELEWNADGSACLWAYGLAVYQDRGGRSGSYERSTYQGALVIGMDGTARLVPHTGFDKRYPPVYRYLHWASDGRDLLAVVSAQLLDQAAPAGRELLVRLDASTGEILWQSEPFAGCVGMFPHPNFDLKAFHDPEAAGL